MQKLNPMIPDNRAVSKKPAEQAQKYALSKKGRNLPVLTVATQMVVEKSDKAFQNPTKPIGPFYSEAEAKEIGRAHV